MAGKVVLDVLRHVWLALNALNYPVALMGGLALGFWERYRTTQDVEVLIGVGPGDVGELIACLQRAGVRPMRSPPVLEVEGTRFVQMLYQPPTVFVDVRIDFVLAESDFHQQALARRVPVRLEGLDTELFTVSCEDLIILKLIANRIIDRADAAALLRLQRIRLDFGWLAKWVGQLKLHTEFAEIWGEAFPGELVPADFTQP